MDQDQTFARALALSEHIAHDCLGENMGVMVAACSAIVRDCVMSRPSYHADGSGRVLVQQIESLQRALCGRVLEGKVTRVD